MKEDHISFTLYCEPYDIKVSDRIVHGSRERVVKGIAYFTDQMGTHYEIEMRECHSTFHEPIQRGVNEGLENQPAYDPIFKENSTGPVNKTYTMRTIQVLIDPIEGSKKEWIKVVDSGMLEDIDYIMTVDFPSKIGKTDVIIRDNISYNVARVVEHPYQYLVGLKKSKTNYV